MKEVCEHGGRRGRSVRCLSARSLIAGADPTGTIYVGAGQLSYWDADSIFIREGSPARILFEGDDEREEGVR